MKSAFITGITGQDGAYLARLLLEKGYRVHGGVRGSSQDSLFRLRLLGIDDQVLLHNFDLSDPNSIFRVLRDVPVDEFYNLAAHSFVGSSWDLAVQAADVNAMGVARILDGLQTLKRNTRFYQASTSEMFGKVREEIQSELTPFNPRSPYGVAKVYAHYLTVNYRESFGMHASSGILFNHESPLRGCQFVTRKISRTLARIAHGARETCKLGNLNSRRDWGFAGDYVAGMWAMLQQAHADDYVLATGISTDIRNFASIVAETLDIKIDWSGEGIEEKGRCSRSGRVVFEVDPVLFRPAEVDVLMGDASKAMQKLGWQPSIAVTELAQMMARADFDSVFRIS